MHNSKHSSIKAPSIPCPTGFTNMCFDERKPIKFAPNGCPDRYEECMDLNCFEGYLHNLKRDVIPLDCFRNYEEYRSKLTIRTAIRKEYRMMSDGERERFHKVKVLLHK